jgi:hypothetical protein
MMLSDSEFFALFTDFEHSALRLESRGRYDMEDERPQVRAFLAGEMPKTYPLDHTPWTDMLARQTSAGHPVQRTRVVDRPYTDYNRYILYTTSRNVTAGEDIRYLDRSKANELNLPDHDFWVFDSKIVAELRFTADDRWIGADMITEPALVAQHEAWAKLALDHATPYRDYVAEDPTRANLASRLGV